MPHSKSTLKKLLPWNLNKKGNRRNQNPPIVDTDSLSRRVNHRGEDARTRTPIVHSDSPRGNENPPSVHYDSDSSRGNRSEDSDMLSAHAHFDFDSSSGYLSASSTSVVDEDSDTELVSEPLKHDNAVPVSDAVSYMELSGPISRQHSLM
jgi:hypothetical protein